MRFKQYSKLLITVVIYVNLWLFGLLICFFGWKDLGSHAIPLYIRLVLLLIVAAHDGHQYLIMR